MSRNKKILIGAGVVVVPRRHRLRQFQVQADRRRHGQHRAVQKRNLEAIVSASGKIQPKRFVNISADTMGRVTELAVNEGDRVKKGQFLLQIDPAQPAHARAERRGLARRRRARGRAAAARARERAPSAEAGAGQPQAPAGALEGRLTTRETLERAENELKMRQADLRSQEQNVHTQQLRMQQEQATLENAKLRSEQGAASNRRSTASSRAATSRKGETAVVGTMNNAGTVLLTIADMSVIEAEVEVDETDIPTVQIGQTAKITIDAMPARRSPARSPRSATARSRRPARQAAATRRRTSR